MLNVAVQLKTSVSFFDQSLCVSIVPSNIHFLLFTFASDKCHKDLWENRNHNTKQKREKKCDAALMKCALLLSRRPLAAAITSAAGLHWVSLKINERRCFSRHSGLDNLHPCVCLRYSPHFVAWSHQPRGTSCLSARTHAGFLALGLFERFCRSPPALRCRKSRPRFLQTASTSWANVQLTYTFTHIVIKSPICYWHCRSA